MIRHGKGVCEVYPGEAMQLEDGERITKPEGIPIELADCLIRIFDLYGWYGIDMENALRVKMNFNGFRKYRHEGKLA